MKVVVAMKVRDEADVIEANLRYHHARGADRFIVTDNGSVDGTEKVLRRYEQAGLLRLFLEPADTFQTPAGGAPDEWVTRMARIAATEMDADWVIHIDADEFWWPVGGSLKDALAAVPDEYGVMVAPRPELVPRPDGPGEFWERLTVRERHSQVRPKIAHRPDAHALTDSGAHDIEVEPVPRYRSRGRAVLRAVRADRDLVAERLVWAPVFRARVLHVPVRSLAQYTAIVERLLRHSVPGSHEDPAVDALRQAYDEGRLPELYDEMVLDDEAVAEGIANGSLVEDVGLREMLPRCPDPTTGSAEPPPPPPEDVDRELAEITYDAMQSLVRVKRGLDRSVIANRRLIPKLEKRLAKVEKRLTKVRARRRARRSQT